MPTRSAKLTMKGTREDTGTGGVTAGATTRSTTGATGRSIAKTCKLRRNRRLPESPKPPLNIIRLMELGKCVKQQQRRLWYPLRLLRVMTLSNVEPMADTTKMSVDNPEPSAFNKEELQESPLTELLANLRKTVETPLEVAARAVEQLPEAPSMRHSLLLAIVRVKQGSLGRTPHAEHWKKDVKWMKQELSSLVALDRQRLERRRQEVLREEGRGPGELKVVPKVRYWGKSCYADETRVITRRLRQMAEEDGKAELEIAQRERHLAEMKLQMAKTELKAKLIDLKIAKRLT
eukprot:TRINITY_DN1378_c0_g1_i11.p1 TRINITY_DN1378_c0_g1~~TRINITY_DN1378_c0_g1_i11.p1  ORF type:complete len:291 (+),score=42.13 TRINITY_DN1378_c0_g1_i11:228-1100(+)